MPAPLTTVTPTGRHVRLEPLSLDHVDELVAAADVDHPAPRQTAVYSIVDTEWPHVERALESRIDAG